MPNWSELTLFIYITARMSGCVLFNPILNRRATIPGLVRGGMVLAFSIMVFSLTGGGVEPPATIMELSARVLLEMLIGFFLGMVMNFFLYIPQLAGHEMDLQMGLTMSQIYDAGSQTTMTASGTLLSAMMILLFFACNGHHTLLRVILASGNVVRYGAVAIGPEASEAMLEMFAACSLMAVKMALPVIAAELVGQLGMGVLMKTIPQINVFVINIDVKILVGLGLLLLLLYPFSEYLLAVEEEMLDRLKDILALTG